MKHACKSHNAIRFGCYSIVLFTVPVASKHDSEATGDPRKTKTVETADQGRLLTRNRSENDSSTQGYEDFNTKRYPEVKSEGSRRNFTFKFGNDRRNDS